MDRRVTEGMALDMAAVFGRAETRLLRLMAKYLSTGADSPGWAEAKLLELQTFRRRAEAIAEAAGLEAGELLPVVLQRAYVRGQVAAEGELAALPDVDTEDTPPRHAERRVAALVQAQRAVADGMPQRIVRQAADVYQRVVSRAVAGTVTGAGTRLQDAQAALDDFASRGVTTFRDVSGRRWELASYVEMATRTATTEAAVQGHLDRLEDSGIPLVIVSDSSRECERCRPWEGKILSRGPVDAMVPNARTGKLERVRVDGTVSEARSGGLFHPNCTHNLTGYIPGATRAHQAGDNARGYAERQELRRLERKVREWKRREAAAMSPEAERKARAKVREWQGRIRDHVAATGVPRQRNRERITGAR